MTANTRLRHVSAVLVAALLLVVPACSIDDDASTEPASATTTAASGDAPEPEAFEGSVDDFYVVPDPLPPGAPGDLIRTQPLEDDDGDAGLRIMYHSTDVNGTDRAVTGVVYYPTDEPPEGGWPVLALAHGTTGIASQCAPSRVPLVPGSYGVDGVRVSTDYIGLGPVGEVHSYLSATAEGNAMVDSVVAAHQIAAANAGDRWVVYGHSQGGHAALITNEIAAERAPQLDLLGTVAVAPGAQLTETYGDTIQTRIITTMVLFGAVDENPDLDPADYLGPDAYAAGKQVVAEECLGSIIDTMLPLAASDDFYIQEPAESGEALAFMESNDTATVVSESPLLVINGLQDITVVPKRTQALYARLCDLDQVVEYVELPEADHNTSASGSVDQVSAWFADRLDGVEPVNSCSAG